jgi:hypothetical protein
VSTASEAEVLDGFFAANGKCLAMIELEQAALFTASPPSVDECALSAITNEDFSPHRRRRVPRAVPCLLNATRRNRFL